MLRITQLALNTWDGELQTILRLSIVFLSNEGHQELPEPGWPPWMSLWLGFFVSGIVG
jgi:hypothetical protein